MQRIEQSNRPGWLALIVALVIHLLLVSVPGERSVGTGFARSLLMDALTPAERAVDGVVSGVASLWSRYVGLVGTQEENRRLEAELDQLQMEIQQNREQLVEARRLRRLLGLVMTDPAGIAARVTGGDPAILQRTVTLDKGRAAGVEPGFTARTPDGIVGRVVAVSEFSSIVQLITDPVSAVGAVMQESRIQGRIRGDGTAQLVFEFSEDAARIEIGQVVVTSGSESFYPRGLPIGVISGIGTLDDLVSTAVVEPAADLGRLEEVFLLPVPSPEPVPEAVAPEPTLESRSQ